MKDILILLILSSCSCYDGQHSANMFASGAKSFCFKSHGSQSDMGISYKDSQLCDKEYWKFYCTYNIGKPDINKCKQYGEPK